MDSLETLTGRGFEMAFEGGKLIVTPASRLTDDDRDFIRRNRAELIGRLNLVCPTCRKPVDAKGRCWHCCNRFCEECRRTTGSAFIALCCSCGNR